MVYFFIILFGFIGFLITLYISIKTKADFDGFDLLRKSLIESTERTYKVNTFYEPTYDEVKEFHQKYIVKNEKADMWSTAGDEDLEAFLDRYVEQSELYQCNFYKWLIAQSAVAFIFDSTTGQHTIIY